MVEATTKKQLCEAFVCIKTEPGFEDRVLNTVRGMESVKEAYQVYGVYDVVARVGCYGLDKLKAEIAGKNGINNMLGVRETRCLSVGRDKDGVIGFATNENKETTYIHPCLKTVET